MAGTYWLTILPDTSNLKPGIQAALKGVDFKPEFKVDKEAAAKAGRDAAKIAEDAANKSSPKISPEADKSASQKAGDDAAKTSEDAINRRKPKVKPEADKPGSRKAGEDAASSVSDAFRRSAAGEKLGQDMGARIGGGLKSSLAAIGPMLGGAAILGGLRSALTEGVTFTGALNAMGGVTRATGDQLKAVGDIARQLGSDVNLPGVSATTAAQAMTELAKGGFSVQESMDAARGTLQLAGAAGIDAASAATIQADALHAFGLSAKDAGYAADVLANVANASTGEITDFAQGFQQSGAVASQFGMSIDDTAAALGTLANQGIKGSDAGTLIKSALLAITDQGKPAQGAIKELGLTLYDAQGKFMGMRSMMDQLGQAAKTMSPEMYQAATNTLFGSDAARLAGVAAKEGATGFDALKDAVNKQGGAADMAAARTKGLPGAWANFQNTMDNVKLSIYDMIQGPLTGLLNMLSGVPDFLARNSGAFKLVAGAITTLVVPALTLWIATQVRALAISAASTIGSMLSAWRMMAGAILNAAAAAGTLVVQMARVIAASVMSGISAMVTAFRNLAIGQKVAAAAQWALNVAMSANPIVLIIAAVVAVGAALWAFFTKTEVGRRMWAAIWSGIKTVAAAVWDWMQGAIQWVGDKLTWLWQNVAVPVGNGIKTALETMWGGAKVIWDAFQNAVQWVGDKLTWLWNTVAVPAFNAIKGAAETMWTGVKTVWDTFVGILDTVGNKISAFKDSIANAFNSIRDTVQAVWDRIGGIINNIKDFVSSGPVGAVINAITGGAQGGMVTGGAFQRYMGGGRISGPGTGTSDSILGLPAMVRVANGEYVVNAASTARYLPLLHAINAGTIPGFSGGGTVALGNISGPGITTGEQQSMWDAIRTKFPDAVLSSATRTVMTEGHPDFHNAGRAIDISGPGMGAIASWIASNYPDSLELIHSPFGHNIKNGKDVGDGNAFYGAGLMAAHENHVHWALGKTANANPGRSAESGSYSAVGASTSTSGGGGMSYRPATSAELSASSGRVAAANNAVTQAQQSVDDNTYRRDSAQRRLDQVRAAGKDTTDAQHALDVANRELADANTRLAEKRDKAAKAEQEDTDLRTNGKPVPAEKVSSKTDSSGGKGGMDTSQLGKTFVSGLLESVGLDGSVFSNPLEWPSVKSLMAGANWAGGLLSIAGARPGGADGTDGGTSGGFAAGAADAVGLGGLLSAIPRPSDFTSGSPKLAPGEFNPGVPGATYTAGSAAAMAPHQGSGAAPGAVDNSININGNVGMDPVALQTKIHSEQNARTRTTVRH